MTRAFLLLLGPLLPPLPPSFCRLLPPSCWAHVSVKDGWRVLGLLSGGGGLSCLCLLPQPGPGNSLVSQKMPTMGGGLHDWEEGEFP